MANFGIRDRHKLEFDKKTYTPNIIKKIIRAKKKY